MLELSTMAPTFLLLFLPLFVNGFEDCPASFQSLESSCICSGIREGTDIWCPNSESPQFRFQLQPRVLWIDCRNQDETELRFHLRNVTLGPDIRTVTFRNCAIPGESYHQLMEGMNLTNLIQLSIMSGKGNQLGPYQFKGLGQSLRHLGIENSDFSRIDRNAFDGLEALESLILNGNAGLSSGVLDKDLFQPLKNLKLLHWVQKDLNDEIPAEIFAPLTELQSLRLHLRKSLSADMFKTNTQLVSVNLQEFDCTELESLFASMSKLTNVTLKLGTNFENLPANLFEDNPALSHFEWTFDKCATSPPDCFSSPPSFLRDHKNLKSFTVMNSLTKGVRFRHDFFWGCESLQFLTIKRAKLVEVPQDFLKQARKLEEIDLSFNGLTSIPTDLFHGTPKLKRLDLKGNQLTTLGDAHFSHSDSLIRLDISNNDLLDMSRRALASLVDLEELNLSSNHLAFNDDNAPEWRALTSIKVIDFSFNNISLRHIPEYFRTSFPQLSVLNLAFNQIGPDLEILQDFNFQASTDLFVDLSHNNIQHTSYKSALTHLKASHMRKGHNVKIDMSENPLRCDCVNADLALHVESKLDSPVTSWFEYVPNEVLNCQEPLSSFKCSFPSEIISRECPSNCQCFYAPYQSSSKLRGLVSLKCQTSPEFIPSFENYNVSEYLLDLSHASLTNLSTLKNVENFQLVTALNITGNNLTQIQGEDLPTSLASLSADHNSIKHVSDDIFQRLDQLWLGSNPFLCDCASKVLFQSIQRRSVVKDAEFIALQCDFGARPVRNISEYRDFCLATTEVITTIIIPVVLVVVLAFLLLLLLFVYHRNRVYIWIYSKPSLRALFFSADEAFDKKFDVFISYSNEDASFVEETLVPKLESDPKESNYRCLVHVRDFVVGRPILEQISEAVDASMCTLIVLSEAFVQSDWGRHEFDVAHTRSRIIVVVKGEMPDKEKMPKGLLDYVSSNTFLSWDDPWFWKKLRYSLPHKGARARCFEGLFGRPRNDELHLLQPVSISTITPSSGPCRSNAVSPIT